MIKIRKIQNKEDIKKFIVSWEKVFGRTLSQDTYNWIFSSRNNIYACFDEGTIVAGYCLLDVYARVDKQSLKGGLCNNIFVSGFKYQKMGLFSEITNYALNDIKSRGCSFALGFPNNKAIKAHIRSGWQQSKNLPIIEFKPTKDTLVIDNKFEFKWFSVNNFLIINQLSELISSKSNDYSFSLLKTPDFLDWRFKLNPRWNYDICCVYECNKLVSFFVSKYFEERKRVHLVDYYFSNSLQIKESLSQINTKYHTEMQVDINCIDAWCAEGDIDSFLESGFSKAIDFSYTIFKNLTKENISLGCTPHLTLADNDVY